MNLSTKMASLRIIRKCRRSITTVVEKTVQEADETSKKRVEKIEAKPFESMPGPKGLPVVGNIWRYFPLIGNYSLKRLHHTYEKLYEEYGPVVKEHVFGDRVIVHVYDPHDMYTVYRNEGRLPERRSHRALARYRLERPHLYSCPGLFPSNGEEWYKFRRKFQTLLLAGATGEACSGAIENVTEDLIAKIPSKLDNNKEVDIQPLLFKWALEFRLQSLQKNSITLLSINPCAAVEKTANREKNIPIGIGVITLNRRLGCLDAEENTEATNLVEAVNNIHKSVFQTENSPLHYKKSYKILEESQDYLANVVKKYIEEALTDIDDEKNKHSVLAKMVHVENASKKDVFTMISDMFMAGIDTTAYTLAFTLYNLARNQDVQEKLRNDLMTKLPDKHSRITGNRNRFRYLQLVINESLRMNPVAIGTGRIIPTDLILGGYHVPAKTMVILQHQVSSMLDKYFPEPYKFLPERWDENCIGLVSSPFGYGPRACIGIRIARRELTLSVGKIVRNFSFSYHHEDIDSYNMLINVPDKPVRLRFGSVTS